MQGSLVSAKNANAQLRSQAWKYYVALIAWPAYLVVLPYVFVQWGALSLLFMLFPGVYLFTWLGLLIHECWHKYIPNVPNDFFRNIFSWMLITEPQVYNIVHSSHHTHVHTYQDMEFHPAGRIENRRRRRIYNAMEIFMGSGFVLLVTGVKVSKHPELQKKYSSNKFLIAVLAWVVFYVGMSYASQVIFGVTALQATIAYTISLWMGSFFLHHNQLIEHGNLIVEGNLDERNRKSRNLKPSGILEKIFLFLTHGDAQEHVLHHTQPRFHSRPFPNKLAVPDDAVYITLGDYMLILKDMLAGK